MVRSNFAVRDQTIIDCRRSGKTVARLASEFGLTPQRVYQIARNKPDNVSIQARLAAYGRLTEIDAWTLHAAGWGYHKLALRALTSPATVASWLREQSKMDILSASNEKHL